MPKIANRAASPRIVNVRGSNGQPQQVTIPAGAEIEAELFDPADRVTKGMLDSKELVLDGKHEGPRRMALSSNPDDPAGPAAVQRAVVDADRRTPPRQFGGDGGPEQMPTVDGRDGASTAAQREGAPDPKEAEQEAEDRRKALEKAEQQAAKEAAKESQQAPASRSQPAPANDPRGSRGRG